MRILQAIIVHWQRKTTVPQSFLCQSLTDVLKTFILKWRKISKQQFLLDMFIAFLHPFCFSFTGNAFLAALSSGRQAILLSTSHDQQDVCQKLTKGQNGSETAK